METETMEEPEPTVTVKRLMQQLRFAAEHEQAVVAAEREACAKIAHGYRTIMADPAVVCEYIEADIRTRSGKMSHQPEAMVPHSVMVSQINAAVLAEREQCAKALEAVAAKILAPRRVSEGEQHGAHMLQYGATVIRARDGKFEIIHGINCKKEPHTRTGMLHREDDDKPYDVDGCLYCGRCHCAI